MVLRVAQPPQPVTEHRPYSLGGRVGRALAILTISLFVSMDIVFDKLLVVPWNRPAFPLIQDLLGRLF